MTAALHAALRQAFTAAELAQLHNEADRELNAATDYDLWSRLVDTLFYASQDEGDDPQSIPGQPDGIEDGSRDMPDPAKAGERILAYVSNMGDGLYHAAAGQPLYGRDLESVVRAFQRLTDSEDSRRPLRGERPSMYNDRLAELSAENKRLRDELGSARDWEAWERKEAEIKKLRAECVEYDESNTDLGIALAEARAELDRTKPVVDAAEEWYAAFEYEELDENYSAEERVLFNTIKANPSCPSCGPGGCAGHTRKPSEVERKLPACADCGHRHRWGGECADHSWTDSCPYGAGADCEAEAEERRQCPETLMLSPDEVIVIRCVRAGGHEGNHWNRDREVEWEPIVAAVEVACPRCGGRDGTHTVRDCSAVAG